MNLEDFFDAKSMIASLLSGGFVLFIAWMYKVDQKNKSNEKLRTLIYYEIFLLNGHIKSIMQQQEDQKVEWFRAQIVPGMVLTVYQNSKVQESLIDLKQDEVLVIIKFYNFYLSMESKLRKYCEQLQAKMDIDLTYDTKNRIKSYEDLLIESTQILNEDFQDLGAIYSEIENFKEFKKVVKELALS